MDSINDDLYMTFIYDLDKIYLLLQVLFQAYLDATFRPKGLDLSHEPNIV